MKFKTIFFSFVMSFLLNCIAHAKKTETIPVIAIDKQGNSDVIEVSKEDYLNRLNHSTNTVNDSLIEAFNSTTMTSNSQWHLRTVGVGIGSTMEVGLGKFKIGATPRVRFMFTNNTTPSLP